MLYDVPWIDNSLGKGIDSVSGKGTDAGAGLVEVVFSTLDRVEVSVNIYMYIDVIS